MTEPRYTLRFDAPAGRQVRKLDRDTARRIRAATEALRDNPRPFGVKALKGRPGEYRIRVGDYRIIYRVEDDRLVVLVLRVGHRSDVYDR